MIKTKLFEEIIVPERIATYEDKKTHARTVAFPFDFLTDGSHAVLIITRLAAGIWKPSNDIEKIIINFKDENYAA